MSSRLTLQRGPFEPPLKLSSVILPTTNFDDVLAERKMLTSTVDVHLSGQTVLTCAAGKRIRLKGCRKGPSAGNLGLYISSQNGGTETFDLTKSDAVETIILGIDIFLAENDSVLKSIGAVGDSAVSYGFAYTGEDAF